MIIEFEESNVNDIFAFDVLEDIIDEDADIIFNESQCKTLLGNLLKNDVKKVDTFFSLLAIGEKTHAIRLKSIRDIIACNKLFYSLEESQDPSFEWENDHFYKTENFNKYMEDFKERNRGREDEFKRTQTLLFSKSKPFVTHTFKDEEPVFKHRSHINIDNDKEVLIFHDTHLENVRLIGEVTKSTGVIYAGDDVDIVGYFNHVNQDETIYEDFDVGEYIQNIESIKENDDVTLYFNNFNSHQDIAEGKVSYVSQSLINIIITGSTNIMVYKKDQYSNFFYIYPKDYNKFKYSKLELSKTNIKFNNHEHIQSFINPSSLSELIYVYKDHNKLFNLDDIQKHILNSYSLNQFDIDIQNNTTLTRLFTHSLPTRKKPIFQIKGTLNKKETFIPLLDMVGQKYHSLKTIDQNLTRFSFLKKMNDFGMTYFLNKMKSFINSIHSQINVKNLETSFIKLDDKSTVQQGTNAKPFSNAKLAKSYTRKEDLDYDNEPEVKVFFDDKYDTTMYHIKNEIPNYSNLKKKEKKASLIQLLQKHVPNHIDLDFEIESIMHGKRRVQKGDMAMFDENIYIREDVQDHLMWISKGKTFVDNLDHQTSELTFDMFKSLIEEERHAREYNKNIIRRILIDQILDFHKTYDSTKDKIDAFILKLESEFLFDTKLLRSRTFDDYTVKDVESDGKYSGIYSIDEDRMFNNIDFKDLGNYWELENDNDTEDDSDSDSDSDEETKKPIDIKSLDNYYILGTIIQFTGLTFSSDIKKYIITYTNSKNIADKMIKIDKATYIATEHAKLVKLATSKILQIKDAAYHKKVQDAISKEIQKKETEYVTKIKTYNTNCIISTISMIIILIKIYWPKLSIHKIMPKCVTLLGYTNEALIKYFACLLRQIGTLNDLKFDNFSKMNNTSIEDLLKKNIDIIIEDVYELRLKFNENAKTHKKIINDGLEYMDFYMFKPNLDPSSNKHIMKEMYTQLKDNNHHLKMNMYGIPNTINMCCLKTISSDMNYYDFFKLSNKGSSKTKKHTTTNPHYLENVIARKQPINPDLINFSNDTIIPMEHTFDDIQTDQTNVVNAFDIYTKQITDEILDNLADSQNMYKESWWDEIFYQSLELTLDSFETIMDPNNFKFCKTTIIQGTNINNKNILRETLLHFIKIIIPSTLTKIKNNVKQEDLIPFLNNGLYSKNKDKYEEMLRCVKPYIANIDHLIFNMCDENITIIKNISILAYIFLQIMNQIVLTLSLKHGTPLIDFLMNLLRWNVENNDHDNDHLKKTIELMREEAKQRKLKKTPQNKYDKRIQRELKLLGMDPDIFGEDIDIDLDPSSGNKNKRGIIRYDEELNGENGENGENDDD